jgi:hypothetical protein
LTSIRCVKSAVPIRRIAWSSCRIGRAISTANSIASASAIAAVGEREVQPLLPALGRDVLQALDGALGQLIRRGEHPLRAIGELRIAVRELRLRIRRALRDRQELVQPALAVGQRVERRQRFDAERQQRELRRRGPELLPDAVVIVEQRAVVENQMLPYDALERARLLEELPACPPRLRRLLHRLAALRLQLVERQDQFAQRVEQRQAHEQEAQQNEFEEGTGVIHERRRYNLRQL